MGSSDAIERLRAICADVGFDLDDAKASVIARLRLLADHTETVADFEHMASRARDFFRFYQTTKPLEAFSEVERRIVVLGCLFSDVGKTGPGSADASGQRLIVEMFGVEGVEDDTQPVTRFLETHFPVDADERIRRFAALGLDPKMRIREFWNLHSTWTLEIMEDGGVPPEVIAAAATHHLLDNVNPGTIVDAERRFTRPFGNNASFDRPEKLIILLDKYDALRRRGRSTHDEAIAWLRDRVESNPSFRRDTEFSTLIADLDAAIRHRLHGEASPLV
jgi:hypothetical protein